MSKPISENKIATEPLLEKKVAIAVLVVSILAISFLFLIIYFNPFEVENPSFLTFIPALNACLNAMSATFLVFGFLAIKRELVKSHKVFMHLAFCTSTLFLIGYIYYHTYHGDTHFTGTGPIRAAYFFILISHIVLSIIALPLVLFTYCMGIMDRLTPHKKIAKVTLPIWLYVSVTGVLIFILLKVFG